jgi:hypothetical protein
MEAGLDFCPRTPLYLSTFLLVSIKTICTRVVAIEAIGPPNLYVWLHGNTGVLCAAK